MLWIFLYQRLIRLLTPFIRFYWYRRVRLGKEDPARLKERWGLTSVPRPEGPLLWIHGASVGESLVGLLLVRRIQKQYPTLNILMTSGTRTSALILERQKPSGVIHQYVPLDHPRWVRRFLDYWHPKLSLWVESEIWPSFLTELYCRHIPVVLVNGRMGIRSFERWQRFPSLAAELFSYFSLCLCQNNQDAFRFSRLGIDKVRVVGNLKFSMPPLSYNPEDLAVLKAQIGTRRVWLAASTQPKEDEEVAYLHLRLRKIFPDLLTMIAPRHPQKIEPLKIASLGLKVARRSASEPIDPATDIYFADTIGEMGVMYRACGIVFVGKSLKAEGGQNPIEPAYLDSAIIVGPYVKNFELIVEEMLQKDAIVQVLDTRGLEENVRQMLWDPESPKVQELKKRGRAFVLEKSQALEQAMNYLDPFLSSLHKNEDNP